MSLVCYHFHKWTMVTLAGVTIGLTIGLILLVGKTYGQTANAQSVEEQLQSAKEGKLIGNATGTAMDKANAVLSTAANATANATQTGIEQAKSVMASVTNNVSNATSNTTGTAMNQANKLISTAAPNATGNATADTKTYENRDIGIRMSYPSNWGDVVELGKGCYEQSSCTFGLSSPTETTFVAFAKYSKGSCNCNSLKDLVRNYYESAKTSKGFSFINDSQTTVNKKYPAWQFEYTFESPYGMSAKAHDVVTTNNETYLVIGISYPIESQAKISPQFKKLVDSIEFLPIQVPKTPSFMNGSDMEQLNPSSNLETSSSGLQILSQNSFTDSIGYLHVVGEVQNNSPSTATYVEVTGTFYDSNNQVVGTQFTYTNPSDIAGGDKAPFDLALLSASIPISQVDHYNLVVGSQ